MISFNSVLPLRLHYRYIFYHDSDPNFGVCGSLLDEVATLERALRPALEDVLPPLMVEEWIRGLVEAIASCLQGLINDLLKAIRYGLAKLLGGLNPCFQEVLANVATPALLAAIPPLVDNLTD